MLRRKRVDLMKVSARRRNQPKLAPYGARRAPVNFGATNTTST
jgi:hypothetical protein